MADSNEQTMLALKKFGGLALVIFGLLLVGIGFGGSAWMSWLGIVCLVAGAVLMVLKIVRRNEGKPTL